MIQNVFNNLKKRKNQHKIKIRSFNKNNLNKAKSKISSILNKYIYNINKLLQTEIKKHIIYSICIIEQHNSFIKNHLKIEVHNNIKNSVFNSFFTNKNRNEMKNDSTITNDIVLEKTLIYTILMSLVHYRCKYITTKTINIPTKRKIYTVLKSPHADKKARSQFAKETYGINIIVNNSNDWNSIQNVINYLCSTYITNIKYKNIFIR